MYTSLYCPPNPRHIIKRIYTKLVGKTFDLKISHKKLILPNQIRILSPSNSLFVRGKVASHTFEAEDTVNGRIIFISYYLIRRYYLNNWPVNLKIKGSRVSVPTFQIVANPVIKWNDINRRRFNVIDRVRSARTCVVCGQSTTDDNLCEHLREQ